MAACCMQGGKPKGSSLVTSSPFCSTVGKASTTGRSKGHPSTRNLLSLGPQARH